MIYYKSNTKGYLDITFGPIWDYIPITRAYIENFLTANAMDKESISKIEMSVSELLENAVKYATDDGIRVILKKDQENAILLSVSNYLKKDKAVSLIEAIIEMQKHNSLEYYVKRLRESRSHKETKNSAGCGLARVYHEGNASLIPEYDEENGILELKAVFSIN